MKRHSVKLHPGGRITVPAAIRRAHDLLPGDMVIWFEQNGELCFRKATPEELAEWGDHPMADGTPESNDLEDGDGDTPHQGHREGAGGHPETHS